MKVAFSLDSDSAIADAWASQQPQTADVRDPVVGVPAAARLRSPTSSPGRPAVRRARDWFGMPPDGVLTKREEIDIVRFDPSTKYVGVMAKDGTPKTFYILDRPSMAVS
jgi:hypothetical protein